MHQVQTPLIPSTLFVKLYFGLVGALMLFYRHYFVEAFLCITHMILLVLNTPQAEVWGGSSNWMIRSSNKSNPEAGLSRPFRCPPFLLVKVDVSMGLLKHGQVIFLMAASLQSARFNVSTTVGPCSFYQHPSPGILSRIAMPVKLCPKTTDASQLIQKMASNPDGFVCEDSSAGSVFSNTTTTIYCIR